MKMKERLKKFIPILVIIPLLVGTIGYLVCGETLTDSLYASFALYFTNPVSDAYNGCIEFARWMAPLVTATTILCALKNVWKNICWRLELFGKEDTVAIYSDEDTRISFDKNTKVIYPEDNFKNYAKYQIIMFSSDQKSLQFYEEHKEQLKNKEVYLALRELESGLVKEVKGANLFDWNGSIARLLWKDIALWESDRKMEDIVIYGNGVLAQQVVSVGLQLNLFSLQQQVKYHVISDDSCFQIKHQDLQLLNGDSISYYRTDDIKIWDVISSADVVIVAEQTKTDLLQMIAVRARENRIYYYSPKEGDAAEYLSFGTLIPFGRDTVILTDNNIRRKGLIERAVALNDYYAEKVYQSKGDWDNLSGFLKASNISSADYGEVLAVLPAQISDEEAAELEHIRWCRFHYLNYWRYGVTDNGKNKDEERRIHKDLLPYDQLDEAEKSKDMASVKLFRRNSL